MNNSVRIEQGATFLIGVVAALVLARIAGWWLDSGVGVGTMMASLFVIGFVVARWRIERRRERMIALWAGAVVGMAVQLALRGPGTIWPLVLVVAAAMTAAAVLAGAAVASIFE